MLVGRLTRRHRGRPTIVMDLAKPIGFGPQFNVHVVGDRELLLLSEQRSFRLVGKLYVALVPFLDGKHTGKEIIGAFAGRVEPDRLRQVLTDLLAKSYAHYLDNAAPAARQALWVEFDLPPAEAEHSLSKRSLAVIASTEQGPAGEGARLLREAARDCGIPLLDADTAAIAVVSVDDYLRGDLKELNARMRRQGRAWMPFKAGGGMPMLGPLFRPAAAPCWQCLATAMIENRPGDAVVGRQNDAARPARGFTTARLRLAANFAALEIARALGQSAPSPPRAACARARSQDAQRQRALRARPGRLTGLRRAALSGPLHRPQAAVTGAVERHEGRRPAPLRASELQRPPVRGPRFLERDRHISQHDRRALRREPGDRMDARLVAEPRSIALAADALLLLRLRRFRGIE